MESKLDLSISMARANVIVMFLTIPVVILQFMIFILLRASIPRPRYDQVMDFSWKFCLPLTLVNMLVTAAIVLLNTPAVAAQ